MKITGKQIVRAVEQEGLILSGKTQEQRRLLEGYLEHELPLALKDLLDSKVSAETILRAQLENCRRQIAVGFPRRMTELAFDPNDAQFAQRVGIMENLYEDIVQKIEHLLRDPKQIKSHELDYLRSLGFSPENYQKVRTGQITIGELLLSQPHILVGFQATSTGRS